jgi:hypothetical protein
MRRWLRPVWIFLALLFLLEAWLWDHLEPMVASLVRVVAWDRLRAWLTERIQHLPPWAALIVFAIPLLALLPLKIVEVSLFTHRHWFAAIAFLIFAKLLGVGVLAFIFEVTREKTLQIGWFRSLYAWTLWARDWADAQVQPLKSQLRQFIWFMQPGRAGRFWRRWLRLRRKMQRA